MPDFFHSQAIEETLEEMKRAAQQAQILMASAQELIQAADAMLERLDRAMVGLLGKDHD